MSHRALMPSNATDTARYLTVRQVATRLAVHPETIRGLIDRGELDAVRVGARFRISSVALANYLGAAGSTDDGRDRDQAS